MYQVQGGLKESKMKKRGKNFFLCLSLNHLFGIGISTRLTCEGSAKEIPLLSLAPFCKQRQIQMMKNEHIRDQMHRNLSFCVGFILK